MDLFANNRIEKILLSIAIALILLMIAAALWGVYESRFKKGKPDGSPSTVKIENGRYAKIP